MVESPTRKEALMRRAIDIVLAAITLTTALPSPWFLSPTIAHADTGRSLRLRLGQACPRVVSNEAVTDPQQDWNDPSTGSEPALRGRH